MADAVGCVAGERVGEKPVGVDHQRHVRRLDRDLDVVEADLLEVGELAHRRLHECFGSGATVALVQLGIERSGVDADANGHAAVARLGGDGLDVLGLADVAGVEPQAVHTGLEGGQRQPMLEVDVGHDRHRRPGHDARQPLRRFRLVARAANDVGARAGQRVDLGQRGVDVGRLGDRHRLHADRGAAAHRHRSDRHLARGAALDHWRLTGRKMSSQISMLPSTSNTARVAIATGTSFVASA